MISDKINTLKEDFQNVSVELDRLTQLRLKLLGAIEILEQLKEDDKSKEEVDGDDNSK